MSRARDWYRTCLLAAVPLLIAEIALAREQKRGRGDLLEPFDASDVLEAHGIAVPPA